MFYFGAYSLLHCCKIAGLPKIINNLVLIPHVSSAIPATRIKMAVTAVDYMAAPFKGWIPTNVVNEVDIRQYKDKGA